MTAATRQAVIAESNRLIAMRAAVTASRKHRGSSGAGDPSDSEWPMPQRETETTTSVSDSAFARLVSDLQSTSAFSN